MWEELSRDCHAFSLKRKLSGEKRNRTSCLEGGKNFLYLLPEGSGSDSRTGKLSADPAEQDNSTNFLEKLLDEELFFNDAAVLFVLASGDEVLTEARGLAGLEWLRRLKNSGGNSET
uniref:Uncharacterized protein n=1 Tax=Geoglobus ahangari TaxID=113653 RepID=A0A7C4WEN1_9EURY